MPRKTYTRSFRLQAVRMMIDQGLPVDEVARRLGVTEGRLRTWKQAADVPILSAVVGSSRRRMYTSFCLSWTQPASPGRTPGT